MVVLVLVLWCWSCWVAVLVSGLVCAVDCYRTDEVSVGLIVVGTRLSPNLVGSGLWVVVGLWWRSWGLAG